MLVELDHLRRKHAIIRVTAHHDNRSSLVHPDADESAAADHPTGRSGSERGFFHRRTAGGQNGSIRIDIDSPGAGAYRATAILADKTRLAETARKKKRRRPKPVAYGNTTANATATGPVTMTIRPSAKARAALRKAKRLAVSIAITFTPTTGTPTTQLRTVTTKAPRSVKGHRR